MIKRISKSAVCLFLAAMLVAAIPAAMMPSFAASKTVKPGKPTLTVLRTSGTAVRVKWSKSSGASGYKLYMKEGGSSYRKIATTRKRSYTVRGLNIGSHYYFRVRGYNKRSGALSNTGHVYLSSSITAQAAGLQPYQDDYFYSENSEIMMAGENYAPGYCAGGGYAYFNLQGKYSKMTLYVGKLDDHDGSGTVNFYSSDGHSQNSLMKTISCISGNFPTKVELDLRGVNRLLIKTGESNSYDIGFGKIVLYYAD
jgi:hypothetical protein